MHLLPSLLYRYIGQKNKPCSSVKCEAYLWVQIRWERVQPVKCVLSLIDHVECGSLYFLEMLNYFSTVQTKLWCWASDSCCRMWAAKMRGGSTRGESNNWVLMNSGWFWVGSRWNGLVASLVCNCVADPLVPQPEWELLHGEGSCTLPAAGQQQQQQQPQVTSSPQTCR